MKERDFAPSRMISYNTCNIILKQQAQTKEQKQKETKGNKRYYIVNVGWVLISISTGFSFTIKNGRSETV